MLWNGGSICSCLRQRQHAPLLHGILPSGRRARYRDRDGVEWRQRSPFDAPAAHLRREWMRSHEWALKTRLSLNMTVQERLCQLPSLQQCEKAGSSEVSAYRIHRQPRWRPAVAHHAPHGARLGVPE